MTVLHIGKFYPPVKGGMETIVELICTGTASQVSNRVLVANDRFAVSHEQAGSIAVTRVPSVVKVGAVAVCPTMPMVLAAERPDLIVLHEPNPMALVAYFLARPAAPLIVWFHSEVIRPSWRYRMFYAPFLDFALARARRIVVSSPTLLETSNVLRPWRDKCVVIPFGIDIPHADAERASADVVSRADALRAAYPGSRVLFVGRLVPYKGADILLDAFKDIDATLLIVGDGPCRVELEERAKSLGIAARVRFLGEVPRVELAALYRVCDLFVLPSVSRQEAFGVVLMEAMAAGKPVISTDLGTGTSWVNRNGETGIVVPPRDPLALHAAIDRLLRDAPLRQSAGAAARARVESTLNADRMIGAVMDLYRQVTAA